MISEHTFAAIDFESAGATRGKTDVPVQIGMALWSTDTGISSPYTSYLHTDQPVNWTAQKIHGISNKDLENAPALLSLWPEIKSRLHQNIPVAHGHGTEKRYLAAFPAHGFGPWVDTLLLYRAAYPELPSHALGELCTHFQLEKKIQQHLPDKTWHDALFDAIASLYLLEHLIESFKLTDQPVDILTRPDTKAWHQSRHG